MRTGRGEARPMQGIPDNPNIDWEQAACADHPYPDLFFWDDHKNHAATNHAKEICYGCPIKIGCFQYAYERRLYGVWGATTGRQREKIRKQARRTA